jgi:hypothetical protein
MSIAVFGVGVLLRSRSWLSLGKWCVLVGNVLRKERGNRLACHLARRRDCDSWVELAIVVSVAVFVRWGLARFDTIREIHIHTRR